MTYYETLELNENASIEVIKMAYKALVRKYHPDTFEGDIEVAHKRMAEINEAYEILGDPIKKAEYDGFLKGVRASTMFSGGFEENVASQDSDRKDDVKNSDATIKSKLNVRNIGIVASIVLVTLLVLFLYVLPEQADNERAIEIVKEQFSAEDWAREDPGIKEVYGWAAKKVEPNIYFVEYGFDTYNASKSDGYTMYCYEVNIISENVWAIPDYPGLRKKYVDLGYIDE